MKISEFPGKGKFRHSARNSTARRKLGVIISSSHQDISSATWTCSHSVVLQIRVKTLHRISQKQVTRGTTDEQYVNLPISRDKPSHVDIWGWCYGPRWLCINNGK